MKRIKGGNAVACEYVALTGSGKHTLVNVYGGDILVREQPAMIPIAFYLEIEGDSGLPNTMNLEVFQGRKQLARIVVEAVFEAGKPGLLVLPQLPFNIESDTVVKVVASCEGYSRTTLIEKKISRGDFPG